MATNSPAVSRNLSGWLRRRRDPLTLVGIVVLLSGMVYLAAVITDINDVYRTHHTLPSYLPLISDAVQAVAVFIVLVLVIFIVVIYAGIFVLHRFKPNGTKPFRRANEAALSVLWAGVLPLASVSLVHMSIVMNVS